jgi:hypothetical protein
MGVTKTSGPGNDSPAAKTIEKLCCRKRQQSFSVTAAWKTVKIFCSNFFLTNDVGTSILLNLSVLLWYRVRLWY